MGLHFLQSPLSVGDGSQSPQTDGTFRLRSHRSSFSVPQGAAPALPSASSGEASRTPWPRGLGTPGWVKSSQRRSAEEPLLAYLLSHFIRSIMPSGQQGLSGLICRFKAVLVSVDLTLQREKARCMPARLTFTQTLQIRISHLHPTLPNISLGYQPQGHRLLGSLFATDFSGHLCPILPHCHMLEGSEPCLLFRWGLSVLLCLRSSFRIL